MNREAKKRPVSLPRKKDSTTSKEPDYQATRSRPWLRPMAISALITACSILFPFVLKPSIYHLGFVLITFISSLAISHVASRCTRAPFWAPFIAACIILALVDLALAWAIYDRHVPAEPGVLMGFFSWVAFGGWVGLAWETRARNPTAGEEVNSARGIASLSAMLVALPFTLGAIALAEQPVAVPVRLVASTSSTISNFATHGSFIAFEVDCSAHKSSPSSDLERLCTASYNTELDVDWNELLKLESTGAQVAALRNGIVDPGISTPALRLNGQRLCGGPWLENESEYPVRCHEFDASTIQVLRHFITLGTWRFDVPAWTFEIQTP